MKFGANLHASSIPAHIPTINLARAGLAAPAPIVTDWTNTPGADGDAIGNDNYGCCVEAAMFRWAQTAVARRYNRSEPIITDDVLALYAALTGFNPQTGAGDNGTDPNDAMGRWAKNADTLIFAGENWPMLWATVHPAMPSEVSEAMTQTPLLAIVELPAADADSPENWGNAPGTGPEWKGTLGHAMVLMRNGTGYWTMRTYGMDVPWHPARIAYVDVLMAPLEATRTDFTRLGLDYDKMVAAI